ncbi:hypothetical protein M413DRAFT_281936 [Hebeloma cylindrosporum]|uniref:Uncharacterized protein n=1 Tax=Hebeloma cylindrosporum TaxID=76867 RepID=A0A0C3BZL8_HEBCY|nr:hypothetical protein M413DRAFT_281936 [Hebeloma cylindrosporum h7]
MTAYLTTLVLTVGHDDHGNGLRVRRERRRGNGSTIHPNLFSHPSRDCQPFYSHHGPALPSTIFTGDRRSAHRENNFPTCSHELGIDRKIYVSLRRFLAITALDAAHDRLTRAMEAACLLHIMDVFIFLISQQFGLRYHPRRDSTSRCRRSIILKFHKKFTRHHHHWPSEVYQNM